MFADEHAVIRLIEVVSLGSEASWECSHLEKGSCSGS